MSALGDRIVGDGPFVAGGVQPSWLVEIHAAAEWNGLRQELIELRALAADHGKLKAAFDLACQSRDLNRDRAVAAQPVAGGLRSCPACQSVLIGPTLVECSSCAVGSPPMVPGLTAEEGLAEVAARSCVVCGARVLAGMLECLRCAGSEDAAAKRATDL